MKIQNIYIDGFGAWADKTWADLSPGVNVFHGPNEAGKSTLMAFLRAMLFGFDRRGSARRYEPLKGGAHGGRLDLHVGERPVRIERKPGRHVRGTLSFYDGDEVRGEDALEKLLNGTTRTLYHNVFAFGLEELEQFHTLQENEIAQHISGAGLGIGAARWSAVQRDLDDRQSALFLPRGQSSAINAALRELDGVREELDRTEHQPEDYWAAHQSKQRLAAEVVGLEAAVADLKQRANHYEKRLKSRPLWEKRRSLEARIQALPIIEQFPEGGVERLDLLRKQRDMLREQTELLRFEEEQRRLRRLDLQSMNDPREYAARVHIIESLRTVGPKLDAIRRVYASNIQRRDAVSQERDALASALRSLEPPSTPAFVLFALLIWIGAAGVAFVGHNNVAASILVASLASIYWFRRRQRAYHSMLTQFEDCAQRLTVSRLEMRRVENEAREVEGQLWKLTGKAEVTDGDLESRLAELEQFSRLNDEMRRLDEASDRAEGDWQRVRGQIVQIQTEVEALLEKGAALTEEDFIARANIYKQRAQLVNELERIPLDEPEPGLLFDIRASEEDAYAATRKELVDVERRLIDARHESGRVEERIALMERSEERSRALSRQESIFAKIDAAADSWAVLTVCRTLLDETRKIYEMDRQPEVLRQASSFFSIMTRQAYVRVIAPLDGTDLQVERSDGRRLTPQQLSRGTAEQLYLAMRLALVRDYAGHTDALPVVFDDIFVNFDPERTRQTLEAVRLLAETHQVLVFTCHPHVVGMFQEIVPTARMFPLQ